MEDRHTAIIHLNFLTFKGIKESKKGKERGFHIFFIDAQDKGTLVRGRKKPIVAFPDTSCLPACLCTCPPPAPGLSSIREVAEASEGLPVLGDSIHISVKSLLKMETHFAWVWDGGLEKRESEPHTEQFPL